MADAGDISDKGTRRQEFLYKLILLVVGFALTTVVGGLLTYLYQKASAAKEAELKAMEANFTKSMAVFEEISALLDQRMFRMRRLQQVLEDPSLETE